MGLVTPLSAFGIGGTYSVLPFCGASVLFAPPNSLSAFRKRSMTRHCIGPTLILSGPLLEGLPQPSSLPRPVTMAARGVI